MPIRAFDATLLSVLTPHELIEFDRLIRLIGARLEAVQPVAAFGPELPGVCR
jgi:hypothetical protein